MDRRGFLGAILAAAAAPAIVRADSLMRVIPREQLVLHKAAQIGITEAAWDITLHPLAADGDMLMVEARIAAALAALGRQMAQTLYDTPSRAVYPRIRFDPLCPPDRIYVQRGAHG